MDERYTPQCSRHLQEIYGVVVSPTLISHVTDAVAEEVEVWQNRPLDALTSALHDRGSTTPISAKAGVPTICRQACAPSRSIVERNQLTAITFFCRSKPTRGSLTCVGRHCRAPFQSYPTRRESKHCLFSLWRKPFARARNTANNVGQYFIVVSIGGWNRTVYCLAFSKKTIFS